MDPFKVPLRPSREGTGLTSVAESVLTDVQDGQEQELKSLAERWEGAISKATENIRVGDANHLRIIKGFRSPEAVVADLEKRKKAAEEQKKSTYSKAISVALPVIRQLDKTATIFLIAMGPKYAPKLAMFWGLAYLTITVCFWALGIDIGTFNASSVHKMSIESRRKWNSFEGKLDDLREDLSILNLFIKRTHISEDDRTEEADLIANAIYPVFALLLNFWIESVRWFDSADTDTNKHLNALDQQFEKLTKQLGRAMRTLKRITDVRYRESSSAVQRGEQERRDAMLSALPEQAGHACDEVAFPFLVLPRARTQDFFQPRDSTVASIDEGFASDASSTSLLSVLLHGTGGVGKTETALHYVHKRISDYDIVLWIESETALSLTSSINDISRRITPNSESLASDESNLSNFHQWMSRQALQKKRCLLIYDNVETIDDNLRRYIPTTPGHMIITSQNLDAEYSGTKAIQLRPFSEEDGGRLLRRLLRSPESQLATQKDIDATDSLAGMVEGLPLAIRLLAGLINQGGGESVSSFLKEFVEFPRDTMIGAPRAIGYAQDEGRTLGGDEHPLDRVWTTMSFKKLTPASLTLMGITSFLSPDSIPRSIFVFDKQALNELPQTLKHLDQVCGRVPICKRQFNSLVGRSLLERRSDQCFSIHRLIQEAFRHWCNKDQALQHFTAAVHIVHRSFPSQVNGRPMHDQWDQCRNLIQHGQILATHFHELRERFPGEIEPPPELLELLKSCGWYLFEMSNHHATIALLDTALETFPEKERKSEVYGHLLNTISCCTFELSDLARTRRELDKALTIREAWAKKKVPGAEEELANTLNNYGNLESAEGKYESALSFFSKARTIRVKLGESAIVPLGVTHMTTGRALFLLGKHEEAIAEYKMAEKIFLDEKYKGGPDAHFMAHLNYAYGNLELSRKDMEAAKRFYTEARRILEKCTPLHLLLAACYYKIATLAEREGDQDAALELLNKGLAIAEFRGGKGDAARIMMKKASILCRRSEEEKKEAGSLQIQVQEIVMEHFPNTVYVLESNDEDEWDAWICPYWR